MQATKIKSSNVIYAALALLMGATMVLAPLLSQKANALSGSEFKAGRIMDDSVFFNGNAMTTTQIQEFMNAKRPDCDTNGQKMIYDPAHGDTVTRKVYSERRGVSTPFTCLKDYRQDTPSKAATSFCKAYTGGAKSSAQIINDVSQSCGVSQKVLLILLQKEQSLVTDDWPWPIQYRSATGYGCPDTAPCDAEYYGFFNQVYMAARVYKYYAAYPNSFNHIAGRDNYVLYNPNHACGGTTVRIDNQTTAGLYNYTPYQPNAAALNNLYGAGDSCSAYGNRNFWRMYSDWFGSTSGTPTYKWSIISQEAYSDTGYTSKLPYTLSLKPAQKAYLRVKVKNTGNQVWDQSYIRLATSNPRGRISLFSDNSWLSGSRASTIKEATVMPGAVGTFEFSITAPEEMKSYKEYFTMVAEHKVWMTDYGLYYPINVESADPYYNAQVVDKKVYLDANRTYPLTTDSTILTPGNKLYVTLKIKNIGNRNLEQSFTRLGTSNPNDRVSLFRDSTWLSGSRAAQLQQSSIAPGEIGSFEFSLTTPSQLGKYSESFDAVAEGKRWMTANALTLKLTNQANPPFAASAWQRVHATQLLQSEKNLYRLIMQGDGNLVLRNPQGQAIWATWTMGNNGGYLTMQGDGNLVLRNTAGQAVWTTNTMGNKGSIITLQDDGNLVLRNAGGKAVWATWTMGK